MRLFNSNTTETPVHGEHANAIIIKHRVKELDDGNSIIENTHILRDLRSRQEVGGGGQVDNEETKAKTKMYRQNSSATSTTKTIHGDSDAGAVSSKKHKTNNSACNYTGRSRERNEPRHSGEEYKSRSLERYAKPPHSLAAAVAAASTAHHDLHEDDGDDEEEIYTAARRTLTPCLSTQRRRLLSPFVSMKRRSRSSTSSSGSRSHCDSREVNFNVMLPPLKLPGPMQQHIMEHQKSSGNINCLKTTKQNLGNSASSQSGDSGTGGTELEQDCSRTSAAESSQLSLSYSQLSSASSTNSLSKHSKHSHSPHHHHHHHSPHRHHHDHHDVIHLNDVMNTQQQNLKVNDHHSTHAGHNDDDHSIIIGNSDAIEENDIAEQMHHKNAEKLFQDDRDMEEQHYRDSIFSTDEFYCGNITLVDDTYSNYEPQNEAEEMFLQVVGILRDEKEVGICRETKKSNNKNKFYKKKI